MNKVLAIALNTYKEAVRNKVFYIIFFFGLILLLMSMVLATLALGQDDRIIKDLGLTAINLFGILLTIFVGVNMVYDELDRRTIYTVIASGVTRTEFVLGKFLGFYITIVSNVLLMGVMLFVLCIVWPESSPSASLVMAIILYLFEVMIIAALAVLFSSFSTPIMSAVMTFMCWIIGRSAEDLWEWARQLSERGQEGIAGLLQALYYILPNLSIFNINNQVVYREDVGELGAIVFLYPFYGILYTVILLAITILSFSQRDFK